MIAELIICLTIESYRCGSRRFDPYTGGLRQAMVSTDCVTVGSTLVCIDWCVSILS